MTTGRPAASAALLAWFDGRRAAYPWRRSRDPYAVLVSEFMLQQTQASRVAPAFERFMAAFPSVETLARAPREAVLRAWGGLGYNRRAVHLSRAAGEIVERHAGAVPRDPFALRSLPGVGPYTAAAVASIAYGVPVAAVDTNVTRVVGRAIAGRDDLPRADSERLADRWLDRARPGEWNQAVMDLGRTFCRSRPVCAGCPVSGSCAFRASGALPARSVRRQPPFPGSGRQVRGAVVRTLRRRGASTIASLATATGEPLERVAEAVRALAKDGIVAAGPRARDGAPAGLVRLGS